MGADPAYHAISHTGGRHEHEIEGKVWYMPCKERSDLTDDILEDYQRGESSVDRASKGSTKAFCERTWPSRQECGEAREGACEGRLWGGLLLVRVHQVAG